MTGSTLNQIGAIQNEEAQLKLLRARTRTYVTATRVMVLQLGLTLGVPIGGAILAAFLPVLQAWVAAAALVIVVIDALFIDRRQMALIKQAAKIGEKFDCVVLELPWDPFTVGDDLEAEDIHKAAKAFAARHDDSPLKNWYPQAVGELPLHLARIVCQRTNLRYDSQLRRSYGAVLKVSSISLFGVFLVWGLAHDASMTSLVLMMAPATPFLAWASREYYRQVDTADLLDSIIKEARKFWARALAGECSPAGCRVMSREFQSSIYARRATSPMVLPFLYLMKRLSLEDEMDEGAAGFLREYARSKTEAKTEGQL